MAYGVIIVNEKQSPTFNLGDYVQALAALQYLPNGENPFYIERDNLSDFHKDTDVKVIMNGWWMEEPDNFPPTECILPLYRSFHLRPKIEKEFFSEETISHLKKYQPIGCRDTNTAKMMRSHGIEAYYSSCLTLTLGISYKHTCRNSSPVYIVDPFVGKFICKDMFRSICMMFRCVYAAVFKRALIRKVAHRIKETCPYPQQGFALLLYSTKICAVYGGTFESALLEKATYYTHDIPSKALISHRERLDYASQVLYCYSIAKFVITSRIHCGLPCLGMGTPVVFVAVDAISPGRLGGILDLFRSAYISKGKCVLNRKDFSVKKIGLANSFPNKEEYKKYAEKLAFDCQNFFK